MLRETIGHAGRERKCELARLMGVRGVCVAAVLLQTTIFGFGSALTKVAYDSLSPWWFLVLRFGIAALALILLCGPRIAGSLRTVRVRDWLPAALCMACAYVSCNVALDLTTATNVGFLSGLAVMFAPAIALVVLRRRYRALHVPFQLAVVAGLFLLCSGGGSLVFGWGEALALLCSLACAAALVFSERGVSRMDVTILAFTQIAVTFLVSLAGAFAFDGPLDIAAVSFDAWVVVAFMALVGTCLVFAIQNAALKSLSSATVSMLLATEPVLTAAFSWLLLGETLSLAGLAGAAVTMACVVGETLVDAREDAPRAIPAPASKTRTALASESCAASSFAPCAPAPCAASAPSPCTALASEARTSSTSGSRRRFFVALTWVRWMD